MNMAYTKVFISSKYSIYKSRDATLEFNIQNISLLFVSLIYIMNDIHKMSNTSSCYVEKNITRYVYIYNSQPRNRETFLTTLTSPVMFKM